MKFVATKKGLTTYFSPSSFALLLDQGWIKIRIGDQHPGSATL
jgi:hypothetical protein